MRSRIIPLAVVALVLLAMVGAVYLAMRPGQPESETPTVAQPAPGEKEPAAQRVDIRGAEIEQRDLSGKLQWKVTAGAQVEVDKSKSVARFKQVKFELVQAGQTPLEVEAPELVADGKQLRFEGGVKGKMTDGSGTFELPRVVYEISTGKLLGSGGGSFVMGAYAATGRDMVVDTKAGKVRFRGGAHFARRG